MDFSWFPLVVNFLLLGAVVFICRTINTRRKMLAWNGALLFFVFCFIAMVLDFTLTMVFASASFHDRTEYETVSSRAAWSGRVLSYLIPCIVSMLLALRFRQRQRFASMQTRGESARTGQIEKSAYRRSELTL